MKKILILGASELQVPGILQAQKMGLYVISADYDESAVGFKYSDKKYLVSTTDSDAILKIAKKEKVSGIMTLASDLPIKTVAYVSQKLNLPGPRVEVAEIVTDKFKMRKRFKECNIQSIDYKLVKKIDDLTGFLEKRNTDSILKPVSSSGSRGISFISLKDSSDEIVKKFEYSMSFSKTKELIVEDFLIGDEVSVETLTIEGQTKIIQITNKLTTKKPHFVEVGHSQPSFFSKEVNKKIEELVKKTIEAVGLDNGPAHTEIIINDDELNVVEIGARLGGDFITTELVPISTGINMVQAVIKMSIGEEVDINQGVEAGAAIRFFNFSKGIVKRIEGFEEIKQMSGVLKTQLDLTEGDRIPEINNSVSRYGYVITKGSDALEAIRTCEKALELLNVDILEES